VEGNGVRMRAAPLALMNSTLFLNKNGFIESTRLFLPERIQLLLLAEHSSTESFKRGC